MGFFAEAGPLGFFVSAHLIPDDFDFDQTDEPAFVSSDEEVRIQQGTEVRLRIVGVKTDATEIVRFSFTMPLWSPKDWSQDKYKSLSPINTPFWDLTRNYDLQTIYLVRIQEDLWVQGRTLTMELFVSVEVLITVLLAYTILGKI